MASIIPRKAIMSHAMPLHQLAAALPDGRIEGGADIAITALTHDSREVSPGALFVCLKGERFDGHAFAPQALAQGASALVVNAGGLEAAGVTNPDSPPRIV